MGRCRRCRCTCSSAARCIAGRRAAAARRIDDFPLLVRWFKEGKFPLDLMVTKRYKLEEINEACAALQRGEIAGRAIVEF